MLVIALACLSAPLINARNYKTLLLIAILLPCLSIGFYWRWGGAREWVAYEHAQQQDIRARKQLARFGTSTEVIAKLREHLRKDPGSAQGWYLLGRLYMSDQRYRQASATFKMADKLRPNDPRILAQYAEAMYLDNSAPKEVRITAIRMANRVVQLDPQNAEAIFKGKLQRSSPLMAKFVKSLLCYKSKC